MSSWTPQQSSDLYRVPNWGAGYFSVSESGTLLVHPRLADGPTIDLHNLFGDTDAVHVRLDDGGDYQIEHFVEGDNVTEVLSYVQYDRRDLTERVRKLIEKAMRAGHISLEDSALLRRRYDQGLADYTYLRDEN